mmetsp:Transcript_34186/g.76974  ORF Transcript_34186/g.76974 Transcript_34186/m.76974 type:complete len:116 (+) Transcript_34186:889-1236(+)
MLRVSQALGASKGLAGIKLVCFCSPRPHPNRCFPVMSCTIEEALNVESLRHVHRRYRRGSWFSKLLALELAHLADERLMGGADLVRLAHEAGRLLAWQLRVFSSGALDGSSQDLS